MPEGKVAKNVEAVCREIPCRGELSSQSLAAALRKLDEIRELLLGNPVRIETTMNRELIGVLEIVIDEKKPVEGAQGKVEVSQ